MAFRTFTLAALMLVASAVHGQDVPASMTETEKLSYALGMSLGDQLAKQGVDLDVAMYARGLTDALSGSPTALTEPEARALVTGLQRTLRARQAAVLSERTAPAEASKSAATGADAAATSAVPAIHVSFKLDPTGDQRTVHGRAVARSSVQPGR